MATNEIETILSTTNSELAANWSLVLTAMEIPHGVIREDMVYHLQVPKDLSQLALREIDLYLEENRDWPPKEAPLQEAEAGIKPPTILLMGALSLFYGVTGPWTEHSHWFSQGAGNSEAILLAGEWFRLVTALTLHADIVHLMGNVFLGGFLLHFFCRIQGTGMGLFSILLSATAGNWLNVFLRGPGHHFVGFSTAVFATIGLLAMVNFHLRQKSAGYPILLPFMAGAALLAMVGSSGERTDLGAHLFGLLTGLLVGRILCLQVFLRLRAIVTVQTSLILLSGFIIYNSWQAALAGVH